MGFQFRENSWGGSESRQQKELGGSGLLELMTGEFNLCFVSRRSFTVEIGAKVDLSRKAVDKLPAVARI